MSNSCTNTCSLGGNWKWSTATLIIAPCAELQERTTAGTKAAGLRYTKINAVFLVWVLLVFLMEPGTGAARDQHFHGDAHLTMKWELPLCEDSGTLHRAGRVHRRYDQCFPVKGYERCGSVLVTSIIFILKLDIHPETQWANAPCSHSLVVDKSKGPFSLFETPLPK